MELYFILFIELLYSCPYWTWIIITSTGELYTALHKNISYNNPGPIWAGIQKLYIPAHIGPGLL